MPITFSLVISDGQGRAYERERIEWALHMIEKETGGLVFFKEVIEEENPDIYIYGLSQPSGIPEGQFIIEGEAGIFNQTENKILNSVVYFYPIWGVWSYGKCTDYPVIEIHELLHALGFGHVYDSNTKIMYPLKLNFQNCKIRSIDNETISRLKKIYSNVTMAGDCSKLNIYPYIISEDERQKQEATAFDDFSWERLPVTYSIFDCEEQEINRIDYAINKFEKLLEKDFFVYQDNQISNVNFFCKKDNSEEIFTFETDYWYETSYPAINKHYSFENEKIKQANISLFGYENCMQTPPTKARLEVLAVFRALGLRGDYGGSTSSPKKFGGGCTQSITISSFMTDKIKELYNF